MTVRHFLFLQIGIAVLLLAFLANQRTVHFRLEIARQLAEKNRTELLSQLADEPSGSLTVPIGGDFIFPKSQPATSENLSPKSYSLAKRFNRSLILQAQAKNELRLNSIRLTTLGVAAVVSLLGCVCLVTVSRTRLRST